MAWRFEKQLRFLIFIFFLVGAAGIMIPGTHDLFISLFPFVILLSLFLTLLYHRNRLDVKTAVGLLIIGIAGFFIEVIGVETHLVFGDYYYGNTLGIKQLNTPLLIGVNWILLVYVTGSISDRLSDNSIVKVVTASLLMLVYDILLEQSAADLDMWYWKNNIIPLRNYIAWFVIAVIFHALLQWRKIRANSPMAFPVFISQIIFFLILMIFFRLQ